jgi:hypothetical protein
MQSAAVNKAIYNSTSCSETKDVRRIWDTLHLPIAPLRFGIDLRHSNDIWAF